MDQPARTPTETASEVAGDVDFSILRYAQCWEDADVLLEALAIAPGDACFSIGAAGDNTLSMLSRDPGRVLAVDLSPAQAALIELKAAAFRRLSHRDTLELVGLAPSARRAALYAAVRGSLPPAAARHWDAHPELIAGGVSGAGRFERYFSLFRRAVLPLIHDRATVEALFEPRGAGERRRFYDTRWNNRRWRALLGIFFSRALMGRLGRDPRFFRYVEGSVSERVLARTEHALAELDPSANPYLHWIAFGRYGAALPHAWREENFAAIARNVDRLEVRVSSVEAALAAAPDRAFDRFNLSDIFEYVSPGAADAMFDAIARCARPRARVAYWNMMAPRRRPERLAARLRPLDEESRRLHARALTFFYGAFEVDEVAAP